MNGVSVKCVLVEIMDKSNLFGLGGGLVAFGIQILILPMFGIQFFGGVSIRLHEGASRGMAMRDVLASTNVIA